MSAVSVSARPRSALHSGNGSTPPISPNSQGYQNADLEFVVAPSSLSAHPLCETKYPELMTILTNCYSEDTVDLGMIENGFYPFPISYTDTTGKKVEMYCPVLSHEVGDIAFLRQAAEISAHEVLETKGFKTFCPMAPEGVTSTVEEGQRVVRGLTLPEVVRLTLLTGVYKKYGYIGDEHLCQVESPNGNRVSVYFDSWNGRPGGQLSILYNGSMSLRVIRPTSEPATIIDSFVDGIPAKTREVQAGELPVHTLVPEIVPWAELHHDFRNQLPSWLSESQLEGLCSEEGFQYRRALRDYGLVIPYRYDEDPSKCGWERPLDTRVAIAGEFSQLAARPSDGESPLRGFLNLATGLLIPFASKFREIGYTQALWDEQRVRVGMAISAVPGVASALKKFCDFQIVSQLSHDAKETVRHGFRRSLRFVQIAPAVADCLGSKEVPAVLILE